MATLRRIRLPATFGSLKHRNYRLLWMGNVVSVSGDWMDQIAFSWLIYDMTHSTVALALVNVCRAGPILFFTLIGGVVADRIERRKLMFTTQFIAMLLAFLLAGLLTSGVLTVEMAFAIAVARGVTNSFNQPARQSLISDLVPQEDLPNAISLNSATLNLTRVIGPALGGVLIATIGVAGCFYFNAFSFIAVLYGLFLMEFPKQESRRNRPGVLKDLTAGLHYLNNQKALRTLVFLALIPMILGQPYQTMLTVFAKDVFKSGGEGLGLMQSMAALGALSGALSVGATRNPSRFNLQMVVGLIGFGTFLVLFSISPSIWVALPALWLVGFSNQNYLTSNNTLLQMNVEPEYRGRVLSTLFLQRGMVPLGTMIAGLATAAFGPRWTLGTMAFGLVGIGVLMAPYIMSTLKTLTTARVEREAAASEEEIDAGDRDSGRRGRTGGAVAIDA